MACLNHAALVLKTLLVGLQTLLQRKDGLATAVTFGQSIHATLPVTASTLACFEAAEAAGVGDADATAVPVHWSRKNNKGTIK